MNNLVYDVIASPPGTEASDIHPVYEKLTRQLVASGLMRIDADDKLNFVRMSLPYDDIYAVFSYRQLHDPALISATEQRMAMLLAPAHDANDIVSRVEEELTRLRQEIKKLLPVPPALELQYARLLVQSAHPAVILLVLAEHVEIYISQGQSIGDMLDMWGWQQHGRNSGMQSTSASRAGEKEFAVYVSAGGNPFVPEEFEHAQPTDGLTAQARLMIIAAQELGHFADVKRDLEGNPYDRYAADLGGTRPKPHVREARHDDVSITEKAQITMMRLGLEEAAKIEKSYAFHQQHRPKDKETKRLHRQMKRTNARILKQASQHQCAFVQYVPHHGPYGEASFATNLLRLFPDMLDNLTPPGDVYRRSDPEAAEAINCIEALARVPQQAIKWGHPVARALMPNLYRIYYSEVTPGCIQAFETLTGQKYTISFDKQKRSPLDMIKGVIGKRR